MMELVVTTGAIRRTKRQSNHHHQQTITLKTVTSVENSENTYITNSVGYKLYQI